MKLPETATMWTCDTDIKKISNRNQGVSAAPPFTIYMKVLKWSTLITTVAQFYFDIRYSISLSPTMSALFHRFIID